VLKRFDRVMPGPVYRLSTPEAAMDRAAALQPHRGRPRSCLGAGAAHDGVAGLIIAPALCLSFGAPAAAAETKAEPIIREPERSTAWMNR
jgi:hypothetical protein